VRLPDILLFIAGTALVGAVLGMAGSMAIDIWRQIQGKKRDSDLDMIVISAGAITLAVCVLLMFLAVVLYEIEG
jgi:hypothetical protein